MSEKPDVSDGNKRKLQWMVPTVFVFMVVLIVAFAPEGDTWLGRIQNFQGLIAGALAILGALMTVQKMQKTIHQMQISDERAEQRHRDFISLNLRREALMVDRYCFQQVSFLKEFLSCLLDFSEKLSSIDNIEIDEEMMQNWKNDVNKIRMKSKKFELCKNAEEVNQLMGSSANIAFENINNGFKNLADFQSYLTEYDKNDRDPEFRTPAHFNEKMQSNCRNFSNDLDFLKKSASDYLLEIEDLQSAYKTVSIQPF